MKVQVFIKSLAFHFHNILMISMIHNIIAANADCMAELSKHPRVQLKNGLQIIGSKSEEFPGIEVFYSIPYGKAF